MTDKAKKLGNTPINVVDGEYAANALAANLTGLTKRELFAAMAIQGLIIRSYGEPIAPQATAHFAVEYADALLEELSKEQSDDEPNR
jgi:hypothetical protein